MSVKFIPIIDQLPPEAENRPGRLVTLIASLMAEGEESETAENQLDQAITELVDARIRLAITRLMSKR